MTVRSLCVLSVHFTLRDEQREENAQDSRAFTIIFSFVHERELISFIFYALLVNYKVARVCKRLYNVFRA